jgi:flagellar basal body-associated protein FliL
MDTSSLIALLIVILILIISVFAMIWFDYEEARQAKDEKIKNTLYDLYQDHLNLNNGSLEAYKAMIRASLEASQDDSNDRWV